jgi:Family of unknown function (DUF6220)
VPVGARRWARYGYAASAWGFVAAVIIQVFLAGMALFGGSPSFGTHVTFGYSAVWIVVILLPIFAVVARLPRRDIGLSFVLLGLYIPQCLLPPIARAGGPGLIAALHPVNALLLFALGLVISRRAWQEVRLWLGGETASER